ncbi:MAG: hypothetical protein WA139_05845 [Candidatus Aenigmatarchaeota archaeon]
MIDNTSDITPQKFLELSDTVGTAGLVIKQKGGRTDYVNRFVRLSDTLGLCEFYSRKRPKPKEIPNHVANVLDILISNENGLSASEIGRKTDGILVTSEISDAIKYLEFHKMIKYSGSKMQLKTIGDKFIASESVQERLKRTPDKWCVYAVDFGTAALTINPENLEKEIGTLGKYVKRKFPQLKGKGFFTACHEISAYQ